MLLITTERYRFWLATILIDSCSERLWHCERHKSQHILTNYLQLFQATMVSKSKVRLRLTKLECLNQWLEIAAIKACSNIFSTVFDQNAEEIIRSKLIKQILRYWKLTKFQFLLKLIISNSLQDLHIAPASGSFQISLLALGAVVEPRSLETMWGFFSPWFGI